MISEIEDLSEVEKRILEDPIIQRVVELARREGVRLYLVGGTIRDIILDKEAGDYDFVMEEMDIFFLDQLGDLFAASYFSMGKGRQERVYRLVKEEKTIDFTVMVGDNIHQDLMRRDFTINAIAYSFEERRFYAPSQAVKDLKEGKIDLLSPQAVEMDPLRMLRAVRYRCTLPGFGLTERLKEEIKRQKGSLRDVAPERIRGEMDEIILSSYPAEGLRLMQELGLLLEVFPEMSPLQGLPQGRYHTTDALSHTIEVVGKVAEIIKRGPPFPFQPSRQQRLILGYGALFHDLGKPATKIIDERGEIHFYDHPQHSARLAQDIMRRLKFPNRFRDEVVLLVENHMRILTLSAGEPRDKALRRLINLMGEGIKLLLLLGLAEIEAKDIENEDEKSRYMDLCRRIWDLYEREDLIAPLPLLRGEDLLALGYSPGPRLGEILKEVSRRQITGELKDKEEALKFVREEYPLRPPDLQ
ncbi:MAG: hypothetical protein DRG50_05780 [Deltaproteobacteria bacterium]|nr:MAG: hypothetical protein DRG50_05780 [Deltaproteobacteria bacterium]